MLDVPLPDLDALDALQRIASERRETAIIVMSGHGSIPLIVRAMKAGAVEFLSKPLVNDVVLAAVGQAIDQSQAILQQETEMLELRSRHDSLSHREQEVMGRVVAGDLNKQVGTALGISEITVKAHRGRVMRKMGADSLADLVRMALRLRLPPAPSSMLASTSSRASHRMVAQGGRGSQPIGIMPARSSWMDQFISVESQPRLP
jgi:FixJ family two-component response regulator